MLTSAVYATEHPITTSEDISSTAFWRRPFDERDQTFARLRESAPVSWHEPLETPGIHPEEHGERGFWAIVRVDDIRHVSENNLTFSSARPGVISARPVHPAYVLPASFTEMDSPLHGKFRMSMSRGFTPKAVKLLGDKIQLRATQIVDRVVGAGDFDFVSEVSSRLPMLTVADLVGIPESLVEAFAEAGDNMVSSNDDRIRTPGMTPLEFSMQQRATLQAIGVEAVNERRKRPANDVATALASLEIDGVGLTDTEIGAMMQNLSIAGNDTTKQTTTRTVVALDRNPEQRAWLEEDFDGRIAGSVEEFVRYASPILSFARTALTDTEIGGQPISAGDKVVMFYCSGNRDETQFDDPQRFDLSRTRNAHVAFGGGGIHYCLGNGVAKAQLRALFAQILTKLPHMTVGEPEYLHSDFVNGVTRLPVHA